MAGRVIRTAPIRANFMGPSPACFPGVVCVWCAPSYAPHARPCKSRTSPRAAARRISPPRAPCPRPPDPASGPVSSPGRWRTVAPRRVAPPCAYGGPNVRAWRSRPMSGGRRTAGGDPNSQDHPSHQSLPRCMRPVAGISHPVHFDPGTPSIRNCVGRCTHRCGRGAGTARLRPRRGCRPSRGTRGPSQERLRHRASVPYIHQVTLQPRNTRPKRAS